MVIRGETQHRAKSRQRTVLVPTLRPPMWGAESGMLPRPTGDLKVGFRIRPRPAGGSTEQSSCDSLRRWTITHLSSNFSRFHFSARLSSTCQRAPELNDFASRPPRTGRFERQESTNQQSSPRRCIRCEQRMLMLAKSTPTTDVSGMLNKELPHNINIKEGLDYPLQIYRSHPAQHRLLIQHTHSPQA